MDLRQLAESKFESKEERRSLLSVKAAGKVYSLVGSEAHTEPLLAALFWQILRSSTIYSRALQQARASPLAVQQAETMVVAHGVDDYNLRYDLVVLDPGYRSAEPTTVHLDNLDPAALNAGWERWRADTIAKLNVAASYDRASEHFQRSLELVSALEPSFPVDAMSAKHFGMIVAQQPLLQSTAVPSPCWSLVPTPGSVPVSTIGAVVKDIIGRTGVTVALHSLLAELPSVVPGATSVEINVGGRRQIGIVRSIDIISDSAFVEIFPAPVIPSQHGSKGPLRGVSPRSNEMATFEGLMSGHTMATVMGFSPDLPLVHPYNQLKVFTNPVTSPGDSGAALLDSDDHILGFSFIRTGIGEPIEYSSWIWAESVYAAHKLV